MGDSLPFPSLPSLGSIPVKLNENNVRRYARRYAALYAQASPATVTAGLQWYPLAALVAEEVAQNLGVPDEHGAAIVSAFSPRMHWGRNVRLAIAYSLGLPVATMRSHKASADRCRDSGLAGLNGPKVRAFALAIMGDRSSVTIDSIMTRAAGLDRDAPTTRQRRELVRAIERVARKVGQSPRDCQAVVWCQYRGRAT